MTPAIEGTETHQPAPRPVADAKPVLLAVDDEPGVARAVQRDLRRHYGDDYRVVVASSGAEALDALDRLVLRGQPVALLLTDQRMPRMDGVEFLEHARERVPDAKRVLLTAYSDSQAAIRAINDVSLDYYLTKPWDPTEDLYPVVDDLLQDWRASEQEQADESGLRVIGHRWSRRSHDMRDFLTRNRMPYRWLDVERDAEATQLLEASGAGPDDLPVLVFADGEAAVAPDNASVARRMGLSTQAATDFYDLVVVGAGPAGLASAVYGASEGLRTVLVERQAFGGQAGQSSRIENYLGFPNGLTGDDLTRRAVMQSERLGAEMLSVQDVVGVEARGPARVLRLSGGGELSAHAVVIATGVEYRKLEVPGADRLAGRGLYYGAGRGEAPSTRGEDVYVVGGANSAGQAALYFARFARSVTMLCRAEGLEKSMSRYLIDQIDAAENIGVRHRSRMTAAHGEDRLEAITVEAEGREPERVATGSVFVFIGAAPRTDWLGDGIARDDRGFVLAGPDLRTSREGTGPRWALSRPPYLLETSLPGVFVAGDVRHQSIKRVASAVGDGAMAVQFVHRFLGERP